MREREIQELLEAVEAGRTSAAEAARRLQGLRVGDLGFARVDHEREARCGFPEVVFSQGKRPEQAAAIALELYERSGRVLLTRATPEIHAAVRQRLPGAKYHELARAITCEADPPRERRGLVGILTAGTSDLPVAAEAQVTAEILGSRTELRCDVGVAGLHRLLAEQELLRSARVLVVCAGMEGALASVVGGLVARPVIAVPTSIGYGASFQGLAALLSMLNSCAPNVAVLNIDNGFGAGYLASLINLQPAAD